jgi:hypothetical protein
MKLDSIGGHSHYNPFAEKYRAKNKKHFEEYYAKKAEAHKNKVLEAKKK